MAELALLFPGVKHLHHRALTFDVGVYFEANGHGTVRLEDSPPQEISGFPSPPFFFFPILSFSEGLFSAD